MAQVLAGSTPGRSAAAGKSPELFELKSASLSLLALVLKTSDISALDKALGARLGETPDAFHHDPLLLDLSQLPVLPAEPELSSDAASGNAPLREGVQLSLDHVAPLDGETATGAGAGTDAPRVELAAVLPLLRRHRLQPVGVVGGNAAERAQAAELGLAEAPDPGQPARAEPRVETVVREVVKEVIKEVIVERPAEAPAAAESRTVYVDRPLRSGQQVYAKGADLVILAAVNHGAEVIADGNIHVYAALRGKAIAGARGNTQARIFATVLEAELIAIAGIYRTTENPLPDNVRGKAAQVRLEGEKLIMEPLDA
ncbi:MAG: septum site-determining protein MinC [Burkholderiaceae bacterium]